MRRWDPATRGNDVPPEARALCAGETADMTARQKLQAFQHSVAAGAHIVAESIADEVVASVPSLSASLQRQAIGAIARHYTAIGNQDKLESLRGDYEQLLALSSSLDPVTIAEQIDRNGLEPADVLRLLRQHWRLVLKNPELHLLEHRALLGHDLAKAKLALGRYLRSQGADQVSSGHMLDRLHMAPAAPITGGPLVSVLVSAYNAKDTIGYSIRSLLAQSYQNLEILVCDDASTDDTASILAAEFGPHPKVVLFRSTANQGTYNIRNALIERSRGELLTVQDADDLSLPRRIEYQVQQLRDPSKQASITNLLRMKPDGRIAFFHDGKASRMAIVSLMASRATFAEMGPYRSARFGADFEFLERLKHRFGSDAIARIRSPQLFCLWAQQSATQQPGAQALSSGYRAPARVLYSDLVYRQRVLGSTILSDDEIASQLREVGNWREPSRIERL